MTGTTAIARMNEAVSGREAMARAWRRNGGKVVGYLCDNVPVELIAAAGFLPYRLTGDSLSSRAEVADRLSPFYGRRFAGAEFIDAVFARFVAGELDFLDYLVTPHNRKSVPALIQSLVTLKRNGVGPTPETHFLDRTYTDGFLAERYNRDAVTRFAAQLAAWSAAPIDNAALQAEIAAATESRRLLGQITALRRGPAPRLTGTQALTIYRAGQLMPRADFNTLASALLAEADQLPPAPGVPVFLGGSPWDHSAFYELVEDVGARIVGEDHCWGERCVDWDVAPTADPIIALGERYARQPACSINGSIANTIAATTARARASGAKAAIFGVIRGDDVQMWETPSEIAALEAAGIRCLHVKHVPYAQEELPAVRERIAAFVSELSA